jgi:hypothetical protein
VAVSVSLWPEVDVEGLQYPILDKTIDSTSAAIRLAPVENRIPLCIHIPTDWGMHTVIDANKTSDDCRICVR